MKISCKKHIITMYQNIITIKWLLTSATSIIKNYPGSNLWAWMFLLSCLTSPKQASEHPTCSHIPRYNDVEAVPSLCNQWAHTCCVDHCIHGFHEHKLMTIHDTMIQFQGSMIHEMIHLASIWHVILWYKFYGQFQGKGISRWQMMMVILKIMTGFKNIPNTWS
jgi:hypothetical protein